MDQKVTTGAYGPIQLENYIQMLAENGRRGREQRFVPDESVAALREAGLFRALLPRKFGGSGATPQEWFRAIIRLAEQDMSTAWIAGVLSVHPFQISLMGDRALQEVYGENPDTGVSSSYNPVGSRTEIVPDGIMLHGRWGWSSGSRYCDWVLLGAIVKGDNLVHTCLVPRSDYVIEDTWRVMGLQGTGSNDVVIEKPVFVPSYRIHKQIDGYNCLNPQEDALYSMPWAQIFAATVAAPAIGAARHALRLFGEKITGASTDPTKAKGDPDILRRVAEANALITECESALFRNLDLMMGFINARQEIPMLERVRCRYETGITVTKMMKAVDGLFEVAGGRSVFLGNEIQEIWHDIHIARAHVANNPIPLARNYGNVLLGGQNQDYFL